MKQLILLLCIITLGCNCSNLEYVSHEEATEKMLQCLMAQVEKDEITEEAKLFIDQLEDSIDYWKAEVPLIGIQEYNKRNYQISNKVVFNKDKTQGIGFILQFTHDDYTNVKTIAGEKVNNNWNFYYLENTTLGITHCKDCEEGEVNQKLIEHLEYRSLEILVSTLKFYQVGTCEINPEFFSFRINDRVREYHKNSFLSGTYPKSLSSYDAETISENTNFNTAMDSVITLYSDSLNNWNGGKLPYFMYQVDLDGDYFFCDMIRKVSIRKEILDEVTNLNALKYISESSDFDSIPSEYISTQCPLNYVHNLTLTYNQLANNRLDAMKEE